MHEVQQTLADTVVEHPFQELKLAVGIAQTIAMCQIEHASIDVGRQGLAMQDDATLLLQIAISPNIVVTSEIVHFHPIVGQFRDFSKETRVAFRHNMLVLVPEVEHIAQQVDSGSLFLDTVKESHKAALLHALMWYRQ